MAVRDAEVLRGKHSDDIEESLEKFCKYEEEDEDEEEEGENREEETEERVVELSLINFNKSHIKCATNRPLKTNSVHFLTFIGTNDNEFNKVKRPDRAVKMDLKNKEVLRSVFAIKGNLDICTVSSVMFSLTLF